VNYEGVKQLEQLDEVCRNIVKGRLGTFGVLGNHDYGAQWSQMEVANRIAQTLHKYGVEVLRNSSMQKAGLNFIGIDDYWGLNFNPEKAMRNLDLEKANIVLCHNPDVMDLDVWKGYNSWVLSGHTHGGQVKVPFLPPFILPVKNKRYSAGKIDMEDGRTLYINRALGHLRQVRFNVRPEITVFKLKKVEA
jgi:predicted MPP superfamily phosphohydrolase